MQNSLTRRTRRSGPRSSTALPARSSHQGALLSRSRPPPSCAASLIRSARRLQELFATTVGPVRTVSLSYNAQGQSKGVATVQFNKYEHATSAYNQYNKRLIDGGGSHLFP